MTVLTIPNLLTLGRMVLTVFFFSAGLQNEWSWAMGLFIAAAVTDMVDGTIARLLHQKSQFGAFIDPIADKVMMLAGVSLLTIQGVLPWWLMALIVGRDLYIGLGAFYLVYRKAVTEVRPTIFSKMTTAAQIVAISLGFVSITYQSGFFLPGWIVSFAAYLSWAIILAAALTVVTAIQYTMIGTRLLRSVEDESVQDHRE